MTPPTSNNVRKQNGIAIITVLLIIALMITLLGLLVEQQYLLVRRIGNQNVSEQSLQYAAGVDAWAARVLFDDPDRTIDYWGEDWAIFGDPPRLKTEGESREFSLDLSSQQEREELPKIDFGFSGLEYKIEDLSGRFNLNNLANADPALGPGQKQIFINLLDVLEIGEFDTRNELYDSLVDWLDSNKASHALGKESDDYRSLSTPYFAADQKLTSLGELRFVNGFTERIITTLMPYVTVLPIENARININTTSSEVLSSLASSKVIDISSVDSFLSLRQDKAFLGYQPAEIETAKTAIIGTSPNPQGSGIIENMMQTNSQYFQITTRINLGDYVYCTQTKVRRDNPNQAANTSAKVTILNRQHDTLCNEIVH